MKDVKPNTKALKKESSSDEEDSDDEDEGEEEEASKTPKKNVTLSSSFYILLNSVEKKGIDDYASLSICIFRIIFHNSITNLYCFLFYHYSVYLVQKMPQLFSTFFF